MALTKINNNTLSAVTGLPAGVGGKVLQVVEASFSTPTDISSTSYVDLGLSTTITPNSASNKILILTESQGEIGDGEGFGIAILRGATNIYETGNYHNYVGGATQINMRNSYTYLDSPSTTSAITYKMQVKVYAGTVRLNQNTTITKMLLMEIAG